MGMGSVIGDGFGRGGEDLGLLLRQDAGSQERVPSLYRSGSAPPTVEGSLTAVGGLSAAGAGVPAFSGGENGFLCEEELRSEPAYVSYYYANAKLNPRLPPPVLSKEDWRLAQRVQAESSALGLGGIGDRRKVNRGVGGGTKDEGGRSLFSLQPGFGSHNGGEVEPRKAPGSGEWLDRGEGGLIGLSDGVLGRQKSFTDLFQEDLGRATPISGLPPRPASRSTVNDGVEPFGSVETHLALHREMAPVDGLQSGRNFQSAAGLQNIGVPTSHTFASVLGSSLSRSATPDPQLVARAPSPHLPPVGVRLDVTDTSTNDGLCSFNNVSSSIVKSDDVLAALSSMSLSTAGTQDIVNNALQQEIDNHQNLLFDLQCSQNHSKLRPFLKKSEQGHLGMSSIPQSSKSYSDSVKRNGGLVDLRNSALRQDGQVKLHMPTVPSANSYMKEPSAPSFANPGGSVCYQNIDGVNASFASYGLGGYSAALPSMMANHIYTANLPPMFENAAAVSAVASLSMDSRILGGGLPSGSNLTGANDLLNLDRFGNHKAAAALHMPLADPLYIQYLKTAGYASQANFDDIPVERGYTGNSYVDLLEIQKAYLGVLLQSQEQYGMPFVGRSGDLGHAYYGNPAFGMGASYSGKSPLASPILPTAPVGPGSPLRHGDRNMRFPSGFGNFTGGIMSSWYSDPNGSMVESFPSSLLEEFKSNKTRCFELSEIVGHVVEFSADQYGSRFIQQKLETATIEEKNIVYEEIMPEALSLMTDVFGNYVVQKFFEHGSAAQIGELANQLNGHVLALSLQMYGCRVIQKAIEVVDLDQKTRMVAELDGHVMRCVRDQNGNHVIQKCIECIPQDAIQFIISTFYDQVVTLSTHPYGCRVVQRILEHCDNPKTQQIVMDEIMQCVCMLAQDQYGNYVVQHVLEHGKPHERSIIIEKLAGQIVQMSQQKFASNVVEKCLTFGGPEERQILVSEMLGSTDENEPLQAMMKDQFGNYVVQKVLETCDNQQRELILSRIKVHLNALKKYTYGKHIVARVEKLVAAGERRIGIQTPCPS